MIFLLLCVEYGLLPHRYSGSIKYVNMTVITLSFPGLLTLHVAHRGPYILITVGFLSEAEGAPVIGVVVPAPTANL